MQYSMHYREGYDMKTGLKLLALALAGISLSACSTHHQTGSKDGIFSQKSSGSLDTSRRYYDDLVNRYYYYEAGTNRTFFENGEYRSG